MEGYGNDNPGAFQSTPSSRRATILPRTSTVHRRDFNPHPPHGGRLPASTGFGVIVAISIHALLTEGDDCIPSKYSDRSYFNPRPPHGGRHVEAQRAAWLATDFNPRPPHGGRHHSQRKYQQTCNISIHALLTEGDVHLFQKTDFFSISIHALLTEGDTHDNCTFIDTKISIHALLTEGDYHSG